MDDGLCVSDNPIQTMNQIIIANLRLKDNKIEEPINYLGVKLGKM